MKAAKFLSAHSPGLLIGFGLAGMVVSTILAVKATPKAMRLREETMLERDAFNPEKCEKRHIIKAVLPAYIPAIVVMVASAACIIGGSATNYKRNAALAAALHMTEASLATYQDKVVEIVGEEKAKEVRAAAIKEDIRKRISEPKKVIIDDGRIRCYDRFAGREFWSDKEALKTAALELNEDLFEEDYVTLNDFYYKLDLKPTDVGNLLAWDTSNFKDVGRKTRIIDLTFDAVLVDGIPYMSVGFKIPPTYTT